MEPTVIVLNSLMFLLPHGLKNKTKFGKSPPLLHILILNCRCHIPNVSACTVKEKTMKRIFEPSIFKNAAVTLNTNVIDDAVNEREKQVQMNDYEVLA